MPTYKEAGVDIAEGDAVVEEIARIRAASHVRRKLMQGFGSFAAAYDLSGYREPVMLTTCDGVGTKLELLLAHDLPETAGRDLVAMSVNDILTANARPVMFLDYIAMARLDRGLIARIIAGMVAALDECDCLLAGGETAEMPGLLGEGQVELSGFCVGAAEKPDLLDPGSVRTGDAIVGIPSAGFHANGWSLLRRLLAADPGRYSDTEVTALLAPTRIYHREVVALADASIRPRAMAHITGGGIPGNLPRALGGRGAQLRVPRWADPLANRLLESIPDEEAYATFNMGFGWILVVDPEDMDALGNALPEAVGLGTVTEQGWKLEVID